MPYSLVNYSQQDPAWKSVKIGSSSETIGHVGCAVTSVAMLVSGHGYPETPKTLNAKLKSRGGFVDAAIIWGAVTSIYPGIAYRNLVLCHDTAAPLFQIDAYLAKGQPVLVEVDSSPKAGLQTHWVVLYKKKGNDYLMLDPWPHPTESGQEVKLLPRYSHGKNLKQSITAVVFYECMQAGSGGSDDTATTKPTTPDEPGTYVSIPATVSAGLRFRTQPTTASGTIAILPPGANLRLLDESQTADIGVYNKWLHVSDSQGREGYVAAWYVEAGPVVEGGGEPVEPEPTPTEPEEPTPEPVEPEPQPPVPSDSEGEPEVPVPVPTEPVEETPVPPVPVPTEPVSEGEEETLTIYVSQSVGEGGLRLRDKPSAGGAVVAVEKAGAALTPLEPAKKVRNKIGRRGKWIHVSDSKRRQGHVSARYVELEAPPTDEAPEPPSTPPVSSDSEVEAEPTTETLTVYVSSAASAGLRMRSEPNTDSETFTILPAGSELKVLEGTSRMVGVYGKWLKVREAGGVEGYVAAWYVRK